MPTTNDSPVGDTSSFYSPTLNDCDDEHDEEGEEDDDLSSILALAEMQVYLQKKTAPRPWIFIPIDDADVQTKELEDYEQAKKQDLLDSTISTFTTDENQESLYTMRKFSINFEELGFVDIKLT